MLCIDSEVQAGDNLSHTSEELTVHRVVCLGSLVVDPGLCILNQLHKN